MNKKNFSILINSTDSFIDCWSPFFLLFKKYWPDYNGKIYLNSEHKSFNIEGLEIISVKNNLSLSTWSECLQYAIDKIEEDYFIYMQEDYFFHSKVNSRIINEYFELFKTSDFDCLHLTDQCNNGPFKKNTINPNFWEIPKNTKYRASTQAAFWKKKSFLKIIRPWESGWDFEKFGSKRSNKYLKKIMCVNQDLHSINKNELLPYVFTGIIKGKWKPEIVDVFKRNNIKVNFNKRGFVNSNSRLINKLFTFFKIFMSYCKNYINEIGYKK